MNSCISNVSTLQYCDYIPIVSSYTNFLALFHNCAYKGCQENNAIENNHVYTYFEQKSPIRSVILLLPIIGNLVVGAYDLAASLFSYCSSSSEDSKDSPTASPKQTPSTEPEVSQTSIPPAKSLSRSAKSLSSRIFNFQLPTRNKNRTNQTDTKSSRAKPKKNQPIDNQIRLSEPPKKKTQKVRFQKTVVTRPQRNHRI